MKKHTETCHHRLESVEHRELAERSDVRCRCVCICPEELIDEAEWNRHRVALAEERSRIRNKLMDAVLVIEEKYEDKGDERYGRVKHNNTLLQRALDEVRTEILYI